MKWAWGLNLVVAVIAVAFIALPMRLLDSKTLEDTCPGPSIGTATHEVTEQ